MRSKGTPKKIKEKKAKGDFNMLSTLVNTIIKWKFTSFRVENSVR